MRAVRTLLLGVLVVGNAGCLPTADTSLPRPTELEGLFGPRSDLRLNGNVVEVQVAQSPEQLRRGGPIWAKAGPYIYLFTPQTKSIFDDYGGVGGVRVTTNDGRDRMIARALLHRSTLNSVTWQRAINVSGRARIEGTTRPNTMVDLIEYGEENTEFEYSGRYVARPSSPAGI
jgi:hypothetical protein